jgi:DNA-binding transcriptional MerR regulator
MRRAQTFGLTIAEVSRQTGIPVTTLRFYEKELAGLLPLRRTRGGHRRYRPEDVARLAAVRKLTDSEGMKLADVRRVLSSRGDFEPLKDQLDRLREILSQESARIDELLHRLSRLEERLTELEGRPPRPRKWFK